MPKGSLDASSQFVDNAFVATSASRENAEAIVKQLIRETGEGHLMAIKVPKGTRVLAPGENALVQEIVLNRKNTYSVLGRTSDDVIRVVLGKVDDVKPTKITVKPTIAVPEFKQAPTSIARWMGREGMDFDEAKAALKEMGLEVKDSTLRTQLNAGKKGLRGAPAKLTAQQDEWLRARIKNPATTKPDLVPPKPKKTAKLTKTGIERTDKPTPKPDVTKARMSPVRITHTGKRTKFTDEIWDFIESKSSKIGGSSTDAEDLVELGRKIEAEAFKRLKSRANIKPGLLDFYKQMEEVEEKIEDAVARLVKYTAEGDAQGMKLASNSLKSLESTRAAALRAFYDDYEEIADVYREVLSEIRDLGGKLNIKNHKNIPVDAKGAKYSKDAIEAVRGEAKSLPSDWIKRLNDNGEFGVYVDGRQNPRGFHRGPWGKFQKDYKTGEWGYSNQRLVVTRAKRYGEKSVGTTKVSKNCSLHELTHGCQDSNMKIRIAEQKFIKYRKKPGEKDKVIYRGTNEIGIKDEFHEHYAGRNYDGVYKEAITVGMEGVFYGKHGIPADRNYAQWVLGCLASL